MSSAPSDPANRPSAHSVAGVRHVQQQSTWDCGLACVAMVAGDRVKLTDLQDMSVEEGFGRSTWTIDLCYLLKRFNIKFGYSTITLGVDPGYSGQGFYSRILNKDSERVNKRFRDAQHHGVHVEQRSHELSDIIDHVWQHGPCIVLTNANVLLCDGLGHKAGVASKAFCCCCASPVAYQGHYIVVVGFDLQRGKIIFHNPTTRDGVLKELAFDCFNEARTSYGTDEDIIFVFYDGNANSGH